MKILVLGNEDREHALCRRLAASRRVESVVCAPGNGGIALEPKCSVEKSVGPAEAKEIGIDLVVSGTVELAIAGVLDAFRDAGIPTIGAGSNAAELESSLRFAREFLFQAGVPIVPSRYCSTVEKGEGISQTARYPLVVKGEAPTHVERYHLCKDEATAERTIHMILESYRTPDSGVMIEEYFEGVEVSIPLLTDGHKYEVLPVVSANRRFERRMGAIAPHPDVTPEMFRRIEREILEPLMQSISLQGWIIRGFMTLEVVITDRGPFVHDCLVHIKSLEAVTVLSLIDGDLATLLLETAKGSVERGVTESSFHRRRAVACTVAATAPEYPGRYHTSVPISDVAGEDAITPHFSSVRLADGVLETNGGEVLSVTAVGTTLQAAREYAYRRIAAISFPGIRFHRDIGGSSLFGPLLEESEEFLPQFGKRSGLLPVVVQDVVGGEVLMMGYANAEALAATRKTGEATFYSTSRKELWVKGATSGNRLYIEEIRVDCDQDALLYRVRLDGVGVCHTKNASGNPRYSCFYRTVVLKTESDSEVTPGLTFREL